MANETGESTTAINNRADANAWPRVYVALTKGAELFRPPKLNRYFTKCKNDRDENEGIGISAKFVKQQFEYGLLIRVGVDRYGLDASRVRPEEPQPTVASQMGCLSKRRRYMAYFANGTEGDALVEQCEKCLHGMNDEIMCPIVSVQMTYNYDQHNDGNQDLRAAMNMLIDESGNCRMRDVIQKAGIVIDLSERDQLKLL